MKRKAQPKTKPEPLDLVEVIYLKTRELLRLQEQLLNALADGMERENLEAKRHQRTAPAWALRNSVGAAFREGMAPIPKAKRKPGKVTT